MAKKEVIPYIEELQKSVDFSIAINQEAGGQLEHIMILINKALPEWLVDIKQKY